MTMIETKGPRPYHVATTAVIGGNRLGQMYPANWREPQYPGDSILQADLVKDDVLGDVRVQWYSDECMKVGKFVPGYEECSPGDTPKWWPDKHEWARDRATASRAFVQFLIEAIREGWSIKC